MNDVVPEEAIRRASAHGFRNAAIGLPEPAPFTPRYGSDEWEAAQRAIPQPKPENQRPIVNTRRDPDAPPKPRKSRAKVKDELQEAA